MFIFIYIAFLLAYHWLIPWYLDAYQIECTWDNMYYQNNKLLPSPGYIINNISINNNK